MPTIQELVSQFQAQLDAQQAEAAQRLLSAYQMAYGTLSREQELLLLDIEARRARGETLSAGQIRRMERYRALMRQTEAEMDRYARLIGETVKRDAPGAAHLGTQFAERAFAEQLALLPAGTQAQIMTRWDQMPSEAVAALVGALQDESPLQRLTLAPFGRETAQGIGEALVHGILSGRNPRETARAMANAWGVPLTRALTINRTEQLRAYRMATLESYRRNSEVVRGWTWMAELGPRTCMSCLAQHGSVHGLDETLDDHPNGRCLAPGMLVSGPVSTAFVSRYYNGDLVTIRTASGKFLAVTPNHPILTDRGWIAAGLLQEGSNVVCYSGGERGSASMGPDKYQVPTLIEDIARAFRMDRFTSVPCAAEDFHGDGRGSNVYVVRADRLLGDRVDATIMQPISEQHFGSRYIRGLKLSGVSDFAAMEQSLTPSSRGFLSNSDTAMMLLDRRLFSQQTVSGSHVTQDNACFEQPNADGRARHFVALRQSILGFSSQIPFSNGINGQGQVSHSDVAHFLSLEGFGLSGGATQPASLEFILQAIGADVETRRSGFDVVASDISLDCVVEIGIRAFSGHVYNLQSIAGWYSASSIITHNCAMSPITASWRDLGFDIDDLPPVAQPGDGERWFKQQPEAVQRAMMGPGRFEAWQAGKFEFSQLSKAVTDKDWGRALVETPLKDLLAGKGGVAARAMGTPVREPGQWQTIEDARAWAQSKMPGIRFDLDGVAVENAREALPQLDKLAREYPEVAQRLKYVGTHMGDGSPLGQYPWEGNVYAHAGYTHKHPGLPNSEYYLGLNPEWWGDPVKFSFALSRDVSVGWHPKGCDSVASMLTHEFGHLWDYATKGAEDKAMLKYVGMGGEGQVSATWHYWLKTHKARASLSRYATTKGAEGVAEAFAMIEHDGPRRSWPAYVKQYADVRAALDSNKWLGRGEWGWTQDLPYGTEEYRQASRKAHQFWKKLGIIK